MSVPAPPLIGRDREIAEAVATIQAGGSVLLVGRSGSGKTAVADHVVRTCAPPLRPVVVTGTRGLADQPLAAIGLAGLLPPGAHRDDPVSAISQTMAALASSTLPRPLIRVGGVTDLDAWSQALLSDGIREGHLQVVLRSLEGKALGAFGPLRASGALTRVHLPPLPASALLALAPDDVSSAKIEHALAVADGSPGWFQRALDADWYGEAAPLPPVLREHVDEALLELPAAVLDVLEVAAHARAIALDALAEVVAVDALQVALDAGLLREDPPGVVAVSNVFHRARLQDRARLRAPEISGRIQRARTTARATSGLAASSGPVPARILASLLQAAPAQVLAHLQATPPADAASRVVLADALLAAGRVEDAMSLLVDVLSADGPPEPRTDAAMMLAYLHAHVQGDVVTATATIDAALERVDDADLRIRLRARQITVEAYRPKPAAGQHLDRWEAQATSARTQLEVAKARSLIDWATRTTTSPGTAERIASLLDEVGASAGERWASLAAVFWLLTFHEGLDAAQGLARREMAIARRRQDVGAIGAWLSLLTAMLTLGGHSVAARATGRRAEAALARYDGVGALPMALAFHAQAALRVGDAEAAADLLTRARELTPADNLLTRCVSAVVGLDLVRAQADADRHRVQTHEATTLFEQLGRPAMVWCLWAGQDGPLPPSAGVLAASGTRHALDLTCGAIESGSPSEMVDGVRRLAAVGHLGIARGAVHRRLQREDQAATALTLQHLCSRLDTVVRSRVRPDSPAGRVPEGGAEWPPGPATPRQMELARMAAAGASDREIAGALTLSPRTVSNHLSRLYRDIGLVGRQELPSRVPALDLWTADDAVTGAG